jgi:hypothetical protein
MNVNPDTIAKLPKSITRSRIDDRLNNLSTEHQELLVSWLRTMSYTQASRRIAMPPPEGLGLQSSRSAIQRFYKKYYAIQAIEGALEAIPYLVPDLKDQSLESCMNYLLQTQLKTANEPDADPVAFRRLARFYSRLRDQELRNRSLDIRGKKLQLQLARKGAPTSASDVPGNFVTTPDQSEKVSAVYAQAH